MSCFKYVVPVLLLVFCAVPSIEAHGVKTVEADGVEIRLLAGFLNEPVVVGDKSGVHLIAERVDNEEPVEGLEENLRVSVSADGKKRSMELHPEYNTPGSYQTMFFPTVETTYKFRFTGEINGDPVDLTYTCGEDMNCPLARAEQGFPEPVLTQSELQKSIAEIEEKAGQPPVVAWGALVISVVALGFGLFRR